MPDHTVQFNEKTGNFESVKKLGNNSVLAKTLETIEYGRVLDDARKLINGERKDNYGCPESSFYAIATMWNAYLGSKIQLPINAKDVALMMCLLKIVRESGKHSKDNLVDMAGYVGLAGDLAEE